MNRQAVLGAAALLVLVVAAVGFILLSSGSSPSTTPESSSFVSTTTSTSFFSITTGKSATSSSSTVASTGCGSASSLTAPDWTTYHGANSRTGFAATSATCAKASWRSQSLDGEVYAEPLTYAGMVFVATENDSVYAINATSGMVVWRTHLGTPMQGSALPCGDISPSGITGTPVIDASTGTIYAVAFETPGAHYLVAMNTTDGRVVFSTFADPPGANPLVEQERAALSLGNGRVYVPYGGLDGDCGEYHGWVVGLSEDGSGAMVSYQVPTGNQGGIWGPSGAAMDGAGDLFVATGNGASNSAFDYSDSVIELSPTLQQLGYFAPTNWVELNQGDTDLGSVGPAFVGHGELFQIGKEGVGYLLNATNLGGIGGQVFSGHVCSSSFGGTANEAGLVFVPCTDGMVALSITTSSFQVLWKSSGFPAGPPIITGNVVWALDTSTGTLHGYDMRTGAELFSFTTGSVTRFTTPSTEGAQVFVAAGTEVFSFQIS
jgi:polyvinyl alcohol dehydrogenase (cytochrome)